MQENSVATTRRPQHKAVPLPLKVAVFRVYQVYKQTQCKQVFVFEVTDNFNQSINQ